MSFRPRFANADFASLSAIAVSKLGSAALFNLPERVQTPDVFSYGGNGPQKRGLAEDAVNLEPASAGNSLLTGKNTGKFIEWRPSQSA
jgi:hypothetical protein